MQSFTVVLIILFLSFISGCDFCTTSYALILSFILPFVEDLNLENGVTIPAGAVLVVPVQLVQKDGSCWGSDANEFNPYRFLSKTGKRPVFVQNTSLSGLT